MSRSAEPSRSGNHQSCSTWIMPGLMASVRFARCLMRSTYVSMYTQSSCSMPCSAAVAGLMSIVGNMCTSRIHGLLRYSVWKNAWLRPPVISVYGYSSSRSGREIFVMGGSMYMGRAPFPYSSRSSLHSSILPLSDCGCGGITLPSGVCAPGKR